MRNFPSPFATVATSVADAEPLAAALVAIGHPRRLQIIGILHRHGEVCVGDIIERMGGLSQPATSHHLLRMEAAGLVSRRKQGPFVFYRLQPQVFAAVATAIGVPS
jgi:ArsR family transcriptional regulator, arsenate/arsenite/antimonite-responsive transcriptional repressor